jgi:hypothetical protein
MPSRSAHATAAARGAAASGPWRQRRAGRLARDGAQRETASRRVALQLVDVARRGRGEQPQHLRARTSRSGTSAEVPSSCMSRCATSPRPAAAAGTRGCRRAPRTPPVGQQAAVRVGAAASSSSSTGSSVCWIAAAGRPRRSARGGGRSAPSGDAQPSAPSRARPPSPRAVPRRRQPRHRGRAAAGRTASRAAAAPAGVAAPLPHQHPDDVVAPVRAHPGGAGQPAQPGLCRRGPAAGGCAPSAASCRRCSKQAQEPVGGGEVGPVVAGDVAAVASADSASSVVGERSDSYGPGRAPSAAAARRTRHRAGRPGPSLDLPGRPGPDAGAPHPRRMACPSGTKSERPAAFHTAGDRLGVGPRPSSGSPAPAGP